ncbi:transporter substrate-binding domain-containing diguanylate cyclase [Vibrio sp. LaRot3]|uniref:transporter substrate-binding domain-containing diguanylate cyclase n=1 Tax=Vibrio sp. LaRot3 TaxID=2998829 RepID=UPI0022CDE664|nr:sensor domain-containing diguanylate cyclase [Vibrio sp. LaRot3]MDA0148212.1 sensor domain-containing diguanylate cyclase [Vibrio sp. LaRot3]
MLRVIWILLVIVSCQAFSASEPRDTLVVTNSKAWKPFSFINDQGQPSGLLVDYWQEYGRVNNIDIQFLLVDWSASLKAVKDGEADVHAGLLWSLDRDKYLDYSSPIITIDTQLFVNHTLIGMEVAEFLSGEHPYVVGVVSSGYEQEFTQKNFPQLKLQAFANNADMIEAAFDGKIQAFVADLQVANFYLHSPKAAKLFTGVYHMYSGILRPAVQQNDSKQLLALSKGMNKISEEEKQRIFGRWMYIETVYPTFLGPLLALVFVLVIITYLVVLKMTVKAKTRQLEQANSELKYLSETDPLTGLSNRRHFYQEFSARVSGKSSVGILLFDIDDFKHINDNYGHQVGDVVIQQVGKVIAELSESKDLVGRVGGEEFAIVINKLSYQSVAERAQAVCESIRHLQLSDDGELKVTVSLGCAYYPHGSEEICLSDADGLMYQAKAQGKDRVVSHYFESSVKAKQIQFS